MKTKLRKFWYGENATLPTTVVKSSGNYVVYADVPGVDMGDLKVEFQDGELTISSTRTRIPGKPVHNGGDPKKQVREVTFPIPDDADHNQISASLDRGVLSLTIPKRGSTGKQSITISAK